MRKLLFIPVLLLLVTSACKKHKNETPPKQQDLWPTALGNTWTYKVTEYTAAGASIDEGLYTITIDASKSFGGKTYYGMSSTNMFYENEGNTLFETDSLGSFFRILAKSIPNTDTLFKTPATYNVAGTDYTGTMARVAGAYGTVINGYTCVPITDYYTDVNGMLGKKVVSYYSPGSGPIGFLYYSNPEHPNSDSVYRTKGYILDNLSLK